MSAGNGIAAQGRLEVSPEICLEPLWPDMPKAFQQLGIDMLFSPKPSLHSHGEDWQRGG